MPGCITLSFFLYINSSELLNNFYSLPLMNKALILLIVFLHTALPILADKKMSTKDLWREIQQSEEYIYGVGQGSTIKDASQMALEELVASISTNVESNYNYRIASTDGGIEGPTSSVDINSMVKTYSRMTLSNTKQLVLSAEKDKMQTVVRYMTRADLQEMFRKRGEKVKEYVKIARRAAKNGQVDRALRNYYWALALLVSYPDGSQLQIDDDDFNLQYAHTWIPTQMKEIFKRISLTPGTLTEDTDLGEKILPITVTYQGSPTDEITFSCTDGNIAEVGPFTPRDGKATLYLPIETQEKKLIANISYSGKAESAIDPELADVIDAAQFLKFKEAELPLGRAIVSATTAKQPVKEETVATVNPIKEPAAEPIKEQESPVAEPSQETPALAIAAKVSTQPISASSNLYTYRGETVDGKPDGSGVMTFKASGTFDGVTVSEGDYMEGEFYAGHIYIVNHYDRGGNLKQGNIIKGM